MFWGERCLAAFVTDVLAISVGYFLFKQSCSDKNPGSLCDLWWIWDVSSDGRHSGNEFWAFFQNVGDVSSNA